MTPCIFHTVIPRGPSPRKFPVINLIRMYKWTRPKQQAKNSNSCQVPQTYINVRIVQAEALSTDHAIPKYTNTIMTHTYLLTYVLTYLLTYLLTPWSRVLLEKLTVSAASQEIPRIFGTRRFITVPTSARHLSLS